MSEADWDRCADPAPMLELLRGRASDRKLRPERVWRWCSGIRENSTAAAGFSTCC